MTTYTWEYGSTAAGLQFNIEYDSSAQEFTVTSLHGSFDLNALWFSNGDATSNGFTLPKIDKDLNMNGPNTVWDGTTSSTQTIVWDGFGKLSSAGLGNQGQNKVSFISAGETATFTLADFHLSTFDPANYDTLGVRATSVNGHGDIKWADATPDVSSVLVPSIAQITNTPGDEILNAISGDGSHIVYGAPGATDMDVFMFSSSLPNPPGGGLLTGTFQVINSAAGDQTDPHISGDAHFVTYTDDVGGSSTVRVFDTMTNTDSAIPSSGFDAFLSDVSGNFAVYTDVSLAGSQIAELDLATNNTTIIPGGTQRLNPSVSADNTIAFQDNGFGVPSEIVVYDGQTNVTTRLTNDLLPDRNPDISADGNYVVFQESAATLTNNDVLLFQQTSPGVWSQLANISSSLPTNGEEVSPSISGDGRFVTFSSVVAGEQDIYVWDRDHNTSFQFQLPFIQRNPQISDDGRYISFESQDATGQFDIYRADNPLHDIFNVSQQAASALNVTDTSLQQNLTSSQPTVFVLGDQFMFPDSFTNSHSADHQVTMPEVADNIADQAKDHLPADKFTFDSSIDEQTLASNDHGSHHHHLHDDFII